MQWVKIYEIAPADLIGHRPGKQHARRQRNAADQRRQALDAFRVYGPPEHADRGEEAAAEDAGHITAMNLTPPDAGIKDHDDPPVFAGCGSFQLFPCGNGFTFLFRRSFVDILLGGNVASNAL